MEKVMIVKIRNPEKYRLHQTYGILQQVMGETAVINLDSNKGGMAVNIAHGDYVVMPSDYWAVFQGQVCITGYGDCFPTGLTVWR